MTRSHLLLLGALAACSGPATPNDAGPDAAAMDGGAEPDAAGDASIPADRCIEVTGVGELRLDDFDDTGVRARARLMPNVERQPWDLYVWFQRYGDVVYEGTTTLGQGANDNFGTCTHCVFAMYGTTLSRAFFADSGTIEVRRDPFSPRWDVSIRDARLIEVTISGEGGIIVSTPVEDGLCLRLPDLEIAQSFPPPEWRCERDRYGDGETCDCACGAWDPDCSACEGQGSSCAIPTVGCAEGDICSMSPDFFSPTGRCVTPCPDGSCERGTCVVWQQDRVCLDDPALFDSAALGENCDEEPDLEMRYCAIEGDQAHGICARWYSPAELETPLLCRVFCVSDAECDASALEKCESISGPPSEATPGYCIPRYPPEWSCAPAAYEDGTCNCGCSAWDPDCGDPYTAPMPAVECSSGDVCVLAEEFRPSAGGVCVTAPPGDTCETAAPLPLGAETTLTTHGAGADLLAEACFTSGRYGFDTVHHVDLVAGQALTVRAQPLDERYDVALYLVGPGDPSACTEPLTCAAVADGARRGELEELRFTAPAGGRYFLVLDSFAPSSGEIRLLATIE